MTHLLVDIGIAAALLLALIHAADLIEIHRLHERRRHRAQMTAILDALSPNAENAR